MVYQHHLRVWRAKFDLSQDDLARLLETSQARISRAESGLVRLRDAEMATIEAFISHLRRKKPLRKAAVEDWLREGAGRGTEQVGETPGKG